jgi:ribosomal protein S18 acetylase RimI-like enzyme
MAKLNWQSTLPAEGLSGALLSKIYFLPDSVGKKYGETLFRAVIDEVRERGETFLWLEVLENNPRARKFYESLGMRHIQDVLFTSATQSSKVHILGMGV